MFGYTPVEKDKKTGPCCDINLTNIFVLNHSKAKEIAEKTAAGLNPSIANTALAKDEKSLDAAGEQIVSIFVDNVEGAEEKAYAALKAYAKQFGGPEAEKLLTDDKILSLNEQISPKFEENNDEEKTEEENPSDGKKSEKLNEKYFPYINSNNHFFDEDDSEETDDSDYSEDGEDAEQDSSNDAKDDEFPEDSEQQDDQLDKDQDNNDEKEKSKNEETQKPQKIGFYFVYSLKGVGIKETPVRDAFKFLGKNILKPTLKSIFGYLGQALSGFEIKFSDGRTLSLGDVGDGIKKDLQKIGKGFGLVAKLFKTDPNKAITQFRQKLKQRMPTQSECKIKLMDNKELFSNKEIIDRVDGVGRKKLLKAKKILVVMISGPDRKSIKTKTINKVFAKSMNIGFSQLKTWLSDNVIEANPLNSPSNAENVSENDYKFIKPFENRNGYIVNEVLADFTDFGSFQIDDCPNFDIDQHLFESLFEADKPTKSEKIIITFKHPVDPDDQAGEYKKFNKNIVANAGDFLKKYKQDIPTEIAKKIFKSKGYEFVRWMPKIDFDTPLKHKMTYTALYKKTKDVESKDNGDEFKDGKNSQKYDYSENFKSNRYLDDTDIYLIIVSGKSTNEKSKNYEEEE